MKIAVIVCRILLGLLFFVFGLNQFIHFMPAPPPSGDSKDFVMGLVSSKYFIPMLGVFQTLCGLALLVNRYVPLALIILFPINVNIFLFHAVLAPEGIIMGTAVLLLNVFLIWAYWNQYAALKEAKAAPGFNK